MKKEYTYNNGVHYKYRGWIIYKDKEVPGERKYSYSKGHWGKNNGFGFARTLSLAKTWIDYREDES